MALGPECTFRARRHEDVRAPTITWAALGSPSGQDAALRAARLNELRAALASASKQTGRFDVWVTHMFVLADLTGQNTDSGDALVLRTGADGKVQVVARVALP